MARPKGHSLNRDGFDWVLNVHLGTTVTQIADEAEMSRATLSGLVGGFRGATAPQAHKLASAIGVPVGLLFPTLGRSAAKFAPPNGDTKQQDVP